MSDDAHETSNAALVKHLVMVAFALVLGVITYYMMPREMEEPARRMASIFSVVLVLWITEAIPLFATSLLVIALQAFWIAIPEFPDLPEFTLEYGSVFNAFSNPIIFLFLGGFILARAVQQEKIDIQMASWLLKAFGTRPWAVLAGIMVITAIFSMWMSNTATAAMMIVMVQPFLRQIGERDSFRKALILAVPFAANIGGVGTPIGTPPNAIAVAILAEHGIHIAFLTWMAFAIPLVIGSLLVMWFTLLTLFRPKTDRFDIKISSDFRLTKKSLIVYLTFFVTVFMWLTSQWHGVPTAVVAVIPAAVLTLTNVITRKDFDTLEWNILMLMAGGIALGSGIMATGLDNWIVELMPKEGVGFFALAAMLSVVAVLMSTVISNTVATNILLPIGMAMAIGIGAEGVKLEVLAIMIAVMASYAMALPISTPPNAIAYGSGQIRSKDMLFVGGCTSVVASLLVVLTGPFVIEFILKIFRDYS